MPSGSSNRFTSHRQEGRQLACVSFLCNRQEPGYWYINDAISTARKKGLSRALLGTFQKRCKGNTAKKIRKIDLLEL